MNDPARAITISSVSRRFGQHEVLRDLSLAIGHGELVLLLGANGAGKSTLLRLLAGVTRPDRGEISFGIKARRAYFTHSLQLYLELTVEENLELYRSLLCGEDISEALDFWGLSAHRNKRISELSRGLQIRASLARTFLGSPHYLFLDEPTTALDEAGCELLHTAISALRTRHAGMGAVIVASHDLARFSERAQRICLLESGSIVLDSANARGSSAVIVEQYRARNR